MCHVVAEKLTKLNFSGFTLEWRQKQLSTIPTIIKLLCVSTQLKRVKYYIKWRKGKLEKIISFGNWQKEITPDTAGDYFGISIILFLFHSGTKDPESICKPFPNCQFIPFSSPLQT